MKRLFRLAINENCKQSIGVGECIHVHWPTKVTPRRYVQLRVFGRPQGNVIEILSRWLYCHSTIECLISSLKLVASGGFLPWVKH